jgi:hypothetical protein
MRKGTPIPKQPTTKPHNNLTIQFLEFTYTNDKFSQETIDNKVHKYQPLINSIFNQGWKIDPLVVVTARDRGTTHAPSMKLLEFFFNYLKPLLNTHSKQ